MTSRQRHARIGIATSLLQAHDSLEGAPTQRIVTLADIRAFREWAASRATTACAVASSHGLRAIDRDIGGVACTIFRGDEAPQARVVFLHGGGLVAGDRFDGVDVLARHATALALEVWTVEYPLAPEHDFAAMTGAATEVCASAAEDDLPVLLAGQSAGGGIAAATALACREQGIRVDGLMLVCPMLSRLETASTADFADDQAWSVRSTATGWAAAISEASPSPPGERTDLHAMPPTYLDVGTAEVFRDSVVAYAQALWENGCRAELHTWSGAFHASDCVDDEAPPSREAHRAREKWIRRWLVDDL
ncbi:alpha/beta hydrolase [Demequina muriae]|uniref:Alpha/beta hydrolase fold domain-containing protein n=1 Tax=Demequina muriae TaxID=3051664 RepID=A0ABT8GFQ1_9MICO|nr:alpha/beta hydrolase fold domain-containing protein [Demequina sp. EGI L300058]MDN4480245.1 alpha/beta hydrolase fold domain-containing protein [Demequina sp. EGI L300058]